MGLHRTQESQPAVAVCETAGGPGTPGALPRSPEARLARQPWSVVWGESGPSEAWDQFVEFTARGHHEQTSGWATARATLGWTTHRLVLRAGQQIVGGVQLQVRRVRPGFQLGYVTHGPCIGEDNPELATAINQEVLKRCRELGVAAVVLSLPYHARAITPGLPALGLVPKPAVLPPNCLEATTLLDLTKSAEELFAAMRPSTRRNVRIAFKHGIRLEERNSAGLEEFYRLLVSLCQRRNTKPNPPHIGFLQTLWQQFAPKGWVRLLFASLGDETVSGALAFTFGKTCRIWKVGWSGRHSKCRPNEGMWWHLILWAKAQGFAEFDFVEVDPRLARQVVAAGHPRGIPEGVTSFKLGFGGGVRMLPGAYYHVFNPVLRLPLRLCHHPLVNARWLSRLADRL